MITQECANRSDVSKELLNKLNKLKPFIHHRTVAHNIRITHTPTTQNMTPRPQIHEEILWQRLREFSPALRCSYWPTRFTATPISDPIGQCVSDRRRLCSLKRVWEHESVAANVKGYCFTSSNTKPQWCNLVTLYNISFINKSFTNIIMLNI